MRILVFLLTLTLTQTTSAEVAPEAILGSWQFDSVRTMSEHIDSIARNRPDVVGLEQIESMKRSLAERAPQVDRQVIITFTEDVMISINTTSGTTRFPYKIIGGNVGLVMIEFTDDYGYQSVVNIRLVEGGIAMETTDCRAQPQQCEREKRRAMNQMNEELIDSSGSVDQAADDVSFSIMSHSDIPPSQPVEEAPRIKQVYFKPLQAE